MALVAFVFGCELVDSFGHSTRADDQDASGKGIECSGMSYFDFAKSAPAADGVADFVDHVETGPLEGLVDQQDLPLLKVLPSLEVVHWPSVHEAKVVKPHEVEHMGVSGGYLRALYDPSRPSRFL